MKTRLLAFAITILGGATTTALVVRDPFAMRLLGLWQNACFALAITLIFVGLIMFASSFSNTRTRALMRLDWFLPFLRKKKQKETLSPPSLIVRIATWILPRFLFADRITGKPGWIRKFFKWVGPSMLSSPVRRAIQAICFLLFLYCFFYVCWPYTARPAPPGRISSGWKFHEVDQTTGEFRLKGDSASNWTIQPNDALHVVDESAGDSVEGYVGQFAAVSTQPGEVALQAADDLPPEQLDSFLISAGPWSLYETEPGRWPSHYADDLADKELVQAELFLTIDPLVSLSTAIAARSWVWSLVCAAIILIVCVLIPRGFCGYLCPLGTLIDLFDWAIAGRVKMFRVPDDGWWVHVKYYLLTTTLICAVMGVLVSGFVAAIPVITRGMLFLGEPLQSGTLRGWHLVPSMNAGHFVSIGLFFLVLGLGFLRPRFWCKYVCPSGAVFSLGNLFRVTERKVESTCINCNKCVEICPFDAIQPDFTTRVTDCTLCQTCGGVCPTHAIKFVDRWNLVELKTVNDPPTDETAIGRRGFLSLAAGTAAAIAGGASIATGTKVFGANLDDPAAPRPVRPPGSVPEKEFLEMCIRCGECFKACPNNVLQAEGFQQGIEGLWAPLVDADWAGCESSCNACGQVCPTGAIRALPMEEKKVARMGLAIVNEKTCLPFAGKEECDLCVKECDAAGYHAIEYMQVGTQVDDMGQPIEGTGYLAPVVLADKCVGCGLCQTRCYGINVKQKHLLDESAIIIEAGDGKEDRMLTGSYVELRQQESEQRTREQRNAIDVEGMFPDATQPSNPKDTGDDPFGVGTSPAASDVPEPDPFGLDAN